MKKILTQQPKVSWLAAYIVLLPWFTMEVHTHIGRSAIPFTLRKFTDNPALIGFIGSFNSACGLLLGAAASLISDRIWTRYGRRRPFLFIGWCSAAVVSLLLPYVPALWALVCVILLYQMMMSLTYPMEPLIMEVIPSSQRGRAGAARQWITTLGIVIFYYLLIGGFDNKYELTGGFILTGEAVVYSFNAIFIIGAAGIFFFLVEEIKPDGVEAYPLRKMPVWKIVKELLSPVLLPIFGLAFVMMNIWVGLDVFEALLITDQWGYSKSEFGEVMTYGMLIVIVIVPLAGWMSDSGRFDRLVLLKAGLAMVLAMKVTFYLYAEYFAPGGIPPYYAVIAMGLIRGAITSFVAVAAIPLIFDYVSPNRLGALSCGMGVVFSLVSFVQTNSMGFWITFSSDWLYGLPEGRYNYMAAYHFLFLMGLLGIGYLYLFAHWDKTGFVRRNASNTAGKDVQ